LLVGRRGHVTARHREEMEMLQKLWIATIEEIKRKKKKKK
jgi:hypothetical protein